MMETKKNGLSDKLIIHPGVQLDDILKRRHISQKELAIRTDVSEKHISTIINGTKNISASFAKKLEYALGIPSKTWIELQNIYDREKLESEELNGITSEEKEILKPLKEVISYLQEKKIISTVTSGLILELRAFMRVSNLLLIPDISYNAAYRAQISTNINVNEYVLYAWQRICESLTERQQITNPVDTDLLRSKLPEIKKLMFEPTKTIRSKLQRIFAECGIAFEIVKHFKGAPVQGFIKYNEDNRLILCLTIRQGRADIFWFTLFHEIGHILNGDIKLRFVDFNSVNGDIEAKADKFSSDYLIDPFDYKRFAISSSLTLQAIKEFAKTQNVQPYIVLGRLQHDKVLEWNKYPGELKIYKWTN